MAKIPAGVGPRYPHVVVLVGATGDLARRRLLPGLFHLSRSGFIPGCRIVGMSLDELSADAFRDFARAALDEYSSRKFTAEEWHTFAASLDYVPLTAGPGALKAAVDRAEKSFAGAETRRLHYLSVPPAAALSAVRMLGAAELVERARIVMEKPFGVDLKSAVELNRSLHEVFREERIFRIDHFLGKEPAQNILAFRFANGLFEPIWNRNFIDHVQIDVPEKLGLGKRVGFYETIGAYRDMVVTHLFQILAFMAMEPPTALEPASISEEKNKVFRSMLSIKPTDVVRGQYTGYRTEEGVDAESETETFIALKCSIDNWRWAGVPFYLRTGKRLAEGERIISIAFREPPRSMFPGDSGVGAQGPDHLTFDLADASKMSLSFYGKRPGPGMRLDKLSLQFAMHDTGWVGDVLEAYERLILDAMRGDHTLFTSAVGIERLWAVSTPLLDAPPPVRPYAPGSWGPNAIHQLIAPNTWRLPFERAWRDPNATGN
ncbi:MAG: glucose-6-phosphate dehydrogenase [Gammaproteobacteria bacterium]|nr:glucose-6-phosphate dehydrogenase [Gammaproteobacteria bacterium]MBV8307712.1 glucose-6-phosphate dehydrogenase [Gammaproteobacteria bacterium]MBV8403838.1 glucose-6-phosphate dehydrogenase [Gammaproteobacteria bacterium]